MFTRRNNTDLTFHFLEDYITNTAVWYSPNNIIKIKLKIISPKTYLLRSNQDTCVDVTTIEDDFVVVKSIHQSKCFCLVDLVDFSTFRRLQVSKPIFSLIALICRLKTSFG